MATWRASFELPPTPQAPRTARRMLDELLAVWSLDAGLRSDVELLVSEVVSNAVEHAGSDIALELDVTASGSWLQVGLSDGSSVRPVIRELDHRAPRGRGMQLVAAMTDRWGSDDHRGGKRVWFELENGPDRP